LLKTTRWCIWITDAAQADIRILYEVALTWVQIASPKYHLTTNILRVLYVCTYYTELPAADLLGGTSMEPTNNATRQDVIRNAVSHQIQELEGSGRSQRELAALFNSELNHDLTTWPQRYLEPYLDSDESGRVPLNAQQLQDVLEAAFDRDEALAVEFLAEVNAGKGPRPLPGSSLQISDVRLCDPKHPYELLFNEANRNVLRTLLLKIQTLAGIRQHADNGLASRAQAHVERHETTSLAVEHTPGTGVVNLHNKDTGTDVRKVLGGAKIPPQVQPLLERLGSETRVELPLTDSGTYRGTVLVETADELIQRISPQYAVIHSKDHLDSRPRIGDHVCITYSSGTGRVRQFNERNRRKELAR
jgi:hypothetical protein